MKILLLVAGGRGGSDFFHSLLDSHSQILQFPGKLIIDENFNEMINLENSSKIAKKFINLYPHFFNSKLAKVQRHGNLGKKKNRFYTVDKKKFITNFSKLIKKKGLNKLEILKNLHIAYSLTKKDKKCKKKIIMVHTHLVEYTEKFLKIINTKNITIIHTIRNPLSAINSPVKNWLKYKNGKNFFPKDLYFQLDIIFNGVFDLINLKKRVFIIQLEKIHTEHKRVMRDFCKMFKIKYEKCMEKTTYFGLQWWGDEISKIWISGINNNFKTNIDKKFFFSRDIRFIEYLAINIIKFYKYQLLFSNPKFYFNLFPMKCELLVWKNTFKHRKLKHILSIPFYFLKRILFINKFAMKNINLPYSIGSK